jgi:cysteine synthase
VAHNWLDAGGWEYGARYAVNTPAFMGCSGGVAAVTAYKCAMAPLAMKMVLVVPLPIAFVLFIYCCSMTQEEVGACARTCVCARVRVRAPRVHVAAAGSGGRRPAVGAALRATGPRQQPPAVGLP